MAEGNTAITRINAFQERVREGDLNDACVALEELLQEVRGNNDLEPAVNTLNELIMGMMVVGTEYQSIATSLDQRGGNKVASQVARWPDKVLEKFEKKIGDDTRFTTLVAAVKEALPDYQMLTFPEQSASEGQGRF